MMGVTSILVYKKKKKEENESTNHIKLSHWPLNMTIVSKVPSTFFFCFVLTSKIRKERKAKTLPIHGSEGLHRVSFA